MEFDSLDEGSNSLTKINEGVFYFKDTPEYYVIYVQERNEEYVLVYPIHDKKSDKPTIKHKKKKRNLTDERIKGGTPISNYIKSKVGQNIKYETIYAQPLFVSTIVEHRQDSITGKYGKGFFERTPDKPLSLIHI